MRRKDREIIDFNEIKQIFDKSEVLRIAMHNGDFPYILPVNFGYEINDGGFTLYFHGAKTGTKHAIIQKDNRVSFEIDCNHSLVQPSGQEACTASFTYSSVIGQGLIEIVPDSDKERVLNILLNHYNFPLYPFNAKALENTLVYKIDVLNYTAKSNK